MTVQTDTFSALVDKIGGIGYELHRETLFRNARRNAPLAVQSIKQLPLADEKKRRAVIVISAGPSIRRTRTIERILESRFQGTNRRRRRLLRRVPARRPDPGFRRDP